MHVNNEKQGEMSLHGERRDDVEIQQYPNNEFSSIMYNRIESQQEYNEGRDEGAVKFSRARQPIEMAFLVPPAILDDFYQLHKESSISHPHSAILTIPTQDRVASLVLSIPRTEALEASHKYGVPVIFNSGPP